MRKFLFGLSIAGVIAACAAAYLAGKVHPAEPPAFPPPTNPFPAGIYANGIVESEQPNGSNINIFPEVSGVVRQVFVAEGSEVTKGTPLLLIDDSVQKAITEQTLAQAQAALATLQQLKAEPRKETLDVAAAQVVAAQAAVKTAQDQMDKQKTAYGLNPKSISKDALDTATNTFLTAQSNLEVAQKQYDLIRAGAWIYDIANQEKQYEALQKAHASAAALLAEYTLKAPRDGIVLTINTSVGSYVSPLGSYDTYTTGMTPAIVLGAPPEYLQVRCYVDEILLPRLPDLSTITAEMSVRGSTVRVPLEYEHVQPFVSPKIQLSDQRTERVDVRVLPIIFRFRKPRDMNIYPGQLVDVYIGER
jgi:HlyD family secretion protein